MSLGILSSGGGVSSTTLANLKTRTIGVGINQTTVPSLGVVGSYIITPYSGTITGWNITANGSSPTCTFDVWKVGTGTTLPAVGNSIMGTKPALATGNAIRSSTLTNWGVTVTAGDIWAFNLDAVTTATIINFEIEITLS